MRINPAQKYRRRRFTVFGGLAVLLTGLSYLPLTLLAPVGSIAAVVAPYETPVVAEPALAWPSNAATAVGAVGFPGVLASTGTDEPRAIASITKIITALVVLQEHPLADGEAGPTITFDRDDVRYYDEYYSVGGMVKPVRAGLTLTERELLHVVLIPSANNYAKSLAVWAFGSESAFLDAARSWLDSHGLTSTRIYEPTGMDPANVSTATELLELAKLAIADPTVSGIVAKSSATLPHIGQFKNSNELLGTLGIDGIKTGTLDASGACLLFSADFLVGDATVTVVGVALGGVDHDTQFPQVAHLMTTVAAGFHQLELVRQGDVIAEYSSNWDGRAEAIAGSGYSQLVWGTPVIESSITVDRIGLAADGTPVGSLRLTVDGTVTEVPLELEGSIEDPGPLWRLGNPFSLAG
ncbi:MAG TPA: D-alanyl-D-alanine carboxypeptidase [Homoserinimonas sp.]|nr:D-alanyl-D-alanine carboxypeptidase [Homoserinimonas sp.]